jgi:hypothetical protein
VVSFRNHSFDRNKNIHIDDGRSKDLNRLKADKNLRHQSTRENSETTITLQPVSSTMLPKKSSSSRVFNRNGNKKEITVMLITVTLFFVILQTPAVICNCNYGINNFEQTMARQDLGHFDIICKVGNFFIFACSSLPFFVYCTFNKHFRREFLLLCANCICCCHKSNTQRQSNTCSSQQIILNQINNNYNQNSHFYSSITQSRLHRYRA